MLKEYKLIKLLQAGRSQRSRFKSNKRWVRRLIDVWNSDNNDDGVFSDVHSMLTFPELRMLYDLGKDHDLTNRTFIDLGCHVGGSTHAFCKGLSNNTNSAQVFCFDLFRAVGNTNLTPGKSDGDSFRDLFDNQLRKYLSSISVFEGDILSEKWPQERKIDILFVDAAKTWELNNHINKNFLPSLVPGSSILIQQDYVHEWTPWIVITMEYHRRFFERVAIVGGISSVFLVKKQVSLKDVERDLREMSPKRLIRIFEKACRRLKNQEDRAIIELSKAVLLLDLGLHEEAERHLAKIQFMSESERFKICYSNMVAFISR